MSQVRIKERVRIRRRVRRPTWVQAFERMMQWLLIICALTSVILLFLILAGCTAFGYEQHAAATAAARGCYCAGSNCDEIKSAAGQAAVAAAGGRVVNITKVERPASE